MKHTKLFEEFVNEGRLSSKDQKALQYFCDRVSEEINDEYGDSKGFNADEYTPDAMMEYFVEHIEMNDMTVDELIDDYNWREFTMELGLVD